MQDPPNESDGVLSNESAPQGQPQNDIESIFPLNTAPWNNTQDPKLLDSANHPPLLRFELGTSMIPWRFRILFGVHSYGLHSARTLVWDDIGFDKLNRKSVWRKFGQTLHFLTLEFADVSLEKGYQLDFATRSRTYVQVSGIFVAIICAIVMGKSIQDHNEALNCSVGATFVSDTLFCAMILGLLRSAISLSFVTWSSRFSKWMVANFQLFQTGWALLALILCFSVFYFNPNPECVIQGEEAATYSILIILLAIFFRLRFIYLLGLIGVSVVYVLSARWGSTVAGMKGFMDPVLMAASALGSLLTVYFVEVLLRKDFVQSLAVTTESQRSDRLLRNVLPKRIIDTLKRRQDGAGANASTVGVGPGATALFTRTRGTANMDRSIFDASVGPPGAASRYLVHNTGGSWAHRLSASANQTASRFDSRIGNSLANTALAEAYDSVTILFADVVGFTKISSRVTPEQLVLLLNELFTVFDNIADQNGLEKIKTIGDCYMVCGGLPNPHPLHAHAVARMGIQMLEAVAMFCDDQGDPLLIRIGMHTGSCVAGVIGRRKFIYDVWGDCVNTASRMESHGEPMKVHCSQATAEKIQLDFELEPRGELEVKGKGKMSTYFITAELPHSRFRSVLPADISQWRDRFSSGRASMAPFDSESAKAAGSLQSVDELSPTDNEEDEYDDEIF